jgi:hypothetical protein
MKNFIAICAFGLFLCGCDPLAGSAPVSQSGIKKVTAEVATQADGLTLEQSNIQRRYMVDSEFEAIKHLYIISAWSGDVILYSSVRGKVTSSGKRLSPYSVTSNVSGTNIMNDVGGYKLHDNRVTTEVLQDDGTYGSSIPYIFWFDQRGNYHQHYIQGGQVVHLSDVPMAWPKIILNLEQE